MKNLKPMLAAGVQFSIGLAATTFLMGTPPAVALPGVLTARNASSIINVRSQPTTAAAAPSYGVVGDRVEVLNQTRGSDGYTWYYVRFNSSGVRGWVRGDFVSVSSPSVTPAPSPVAPPIVTQPRPTPRPTPVTPAPPPSAAVRPTPTPIPPSPRLNPFTTDQINYFVEVAMGSEWGGASPRVRKWSGDVRIKVNGSPTAEDMTALRSVVSDINSLTSGSIRLQLVDSSPNVQMYFVPESRFRQYEPNYIPVNLGFFWTTWNGDTITNARILISTTGVTQRERSHLIREELTQSLGLMQDSFRYQDSIFYQGWTETTQYSPLDRALITMLYLPSVRAGMTRSQVVDVLRRSANVAQTDQLRQLPAQSAATCAPSRPDQVLDFSLAAPCNP